MLADILGITLAFASVMLLFSMVVTTTVQAIQATLDLRYQNLRRGLLKVADHVDEISRDDLEKGLNKLLYFAGPEKHSGVLNRIKKWFAIRKTEISVEEFTALIEQELKIVDTLVLNRVTLAFSDLEQYMSKLYQRIMHLLSIVISLVLVFSCQLNTFELLTQLSADPQLREKYISMLEETTSQSSYLEPLKTYPELKQSALLTLAQNNVQYKTTINAIDSNSLSVDAIKNVLKQSPENSKLAKEFENTFIELIEKREHQAKEAVNGIASIGARYNFKIKHEVKQYYWDSQSWVSNLLGTLVSGALISLGAPFWFNAIRNITSMRDRTAKRVQT